jgi:phage shock protein PspC (stress-responsive transcriptional regulator)
MEKKRFHRIAEGKKIAGVCTGLSDYSGIDPVLIRAAFIVSLFLGGIGLLTYLVLWVAAPVRPRA